MTGVANAPTPQRLGAALGLSAAALFGLSTPLAKRLLDQVSPELLAGLLYLGAGLALSGARVFRGRTPEAPLRRDDIAVLVAVVALGGVMGPVLLLIGLARVTAVTGALLLNLEAPFTMALAVIAFREHLGRHAAVAAGLIVLGAVVLKTRPGELGADGWGVLSIAGACLCWGFDNNLTQRLSLKDPLAIARIKTLGAGTFNVLIALLLGNRLPSFQAAAAAAVIGSFSYGLSLVLDTYALRLIGAAREAAYFAAAPFFGALAGTVLLRERIGGLDTVAMLLMATGVASMLREKHQHRHAHESLEHEHAHVHDEHHQHVHQPHDPPGEMHTHPHRHEPLVHEHPHVPDIHHRHRH